MMVVYMTTMVSDEFPNSIFFSLVSNESNYLQLMVLCVELQMNKVNIAILPILNNLSNLYNQS